MRDVANAVSIGVQEVTRPRTSDLDGDGLTDLWATFKDHVETIRGAPEGLDFP